MFLLDDAKQQTRCVGGLDGRCDSLCIHREDLMHGLRHPQCSHHVCRGSAKQRQKTEIFLRTVDKTQCVRLGENFMLCSKMFETKVFWSLNSSKWDGSALVHVSSCLLPFVCQPELQSQSIDEKLTSNYFIIN